MMPCFFLLAIPRSSTGRQDQNGVPIGSPSGDAAGYFFLKGFRLAISLLNGIFKPFATLFATSKPTRTLPSSIELT